MAKVYNAKDVDIRISAEGREADTASFVSIKGIESMAIGVDNGLTSWHPFEAKGWARRMVTSKGIGINFSGKRVSGCEGNDYIASLAYKTGVECETTIALHFPDESTLILDCVVDVGNVGGGSDVAELSFDCMSDGVPFYTDLNGDVVVG